MGNQSLCVITPTEYLEESKEITKSWIKAIKLPDNSQEFLGIPLAFEKDQQPTHYFCEIVAEPFVLNSVMMGIWTAGYEHDFCSTKYLTLGSPLQDLKTKFCSVICSKEDFLNRVGLQEVS